MTPFLQLAYATLITAIIIGNWSLLPWPHHALLAALGLVTITLGRTVHRRYS